MKNKILKNILLLFILLFTFNTAGATAREMLVAFINFYNREVSVIVEKLQNFYASSNAHLSADKQTTETLSSIKNVLFRFREKLNIKTEFGEVNQIGQFIVGGITPSACLRNITGDIAAHVQTQIKPEINIIKKQIANDITQPQDIRTTFKYLGDDVSSIILNDKKSFVTNPLTLKRNISINEAKDLAKVIQYLVNPMPPNSNPSPNTAGNAFERETKRLRYEMFVDILQKSLMNKVEHYVVGDNNLSEKDMLIHFMARANSKNMSKSLVTKYSDGILREINGTLSDILAMEIMNKNIKKDNLALLSILATDTTDELSKGL